MIINGLLKRHGDANNNLRPDDGLVEIGPAVGNNAESRIRPRTNIADPNPDPVPKSEDMMARFIPVLKRTGI